VSSAVHTIKLRKITACDHTFMEWITDYSADGQITLAPCLRKNLSISRSQ